MAEKCISCNRWLTDDEMDFCFEQLPPLCQQCQQRQHCSDTSCTNKLYLEEMRFCYERRLPWFCRRCQEEQNCSGVGCTNKLYLEEISFCHNNGLPWRCQQCQKQKQGRKEKSPAKFKRREKEPSKKDGKRAYCEQCRKDISNQQGCYGQCSKSEEKKSCYICNKECTGCQKKTNEFHESLLKGAQAATMIKHLFLRAGYRVANFGYEQSLPGIEGTLSQDGTDSNEQLIRRIRNRPDYLVQHRIDRKAYCIEVKYRKKSEIDPQKLLEQYEQYPACYFIFVFGNSNILCIHYPDLKKCTPSQIFLHPLSKYFPITKEMERESVTITKGLFNN